MDQRKMHGMWGSRWTFILAATGSAVGLGNIWKFPYIAGENGGGAFVLVYLVCIALVGIPVMMAEVLIGRRGRMSPINAMRYVTREAGLHSGWTSIGWMGVLAGLMIMAFYSVVAGWALNYVVEAGSGAFNGTSGEIAGGAFGEFLQDKSKLTLWHSLFSVMTLVVVAAGVTRGLGMVARVLMPFLFVVLILLLAYGFKNGDFGAAFNFLFDFKFDKLTWGGVLVALGHAFFTLSLGMGAIMAYGAYMPGHASLGRTIITVGLLDTLVALIAGMAIFPIVFGTPGLEAGAGPGLMFVSLPVAFGNMAAGQLFGTLFFVLVAVAAWSSAVSLIEPGVAWLVESKKFNRITATTALTLLAWLGGMGCIWSNNWLEDKPAGVYVFESLDFLTSQIMLPLGGLFIAIFVGWLMRRAIVCSEMDAEGHPLFDIWLFVVRYVSPILIAIVMILSLYNKFVA
ncbi:sodium-dependent transporter [Teredinibacter franksiae]|uniref:sodium-dependent transporter n=1 Tax=Teredinibacter franksiae TaxID=2761453 RepID=UPI0016258B01|nr:sodium-dependent transporter [Teredinibacter franksiae]